MKHFKDFPSSFSHHRRKHHRNQEDVVCLPVQVWLVIGEIQIRLKPDERIEIMQQLHVDETATVSVVAVDVFGNIISNAVLQNLSFDNSDEGVAKSSVSQDGQTVTLDPVGNAVGKETTLNVSATINGTVFTASDTFSVVAGAVAGIQLVSNFNPKSTAQPAPTPAPQPEPTPTPTA